MIFYIIMGHDGLLWNMMDYYCDIVYYYGI